MMRFSKYFKVAKSQFETDFVNVNLDKDLPLFIDPWLLKLEKNTFTSECRQTIKSYFSTLLDAVKNHDREAAMELLSYLHEPSETRLGLAKKGSKGLAIGAIHADQIYSAMAGSAAVRTGLLEDIEDAALYIEGIDRDKISDLVTNVIRGHLIEYTEEQCILLGIPTSNISAGYCWDRVSKQWTRRVANLPIYRGSIVLLVPKSLVSRSLNIEPHDFYRNEFLVFEQNSHLSAASGLCRILKSQELKPPTKKKLAELKPYSKELLQRFASEHGEVLDSYKEKKKTIPIISSEEVMHISSENVSAEDAGSSLREELKLINSGGPGASAFQDFVARAFTFIFEGSLTNPKKEYEINEGRKRIDISFLNSASVGFFSGIPKLGIACKRLYVECKNYTEDIKNGEVDQLIGRMDDKVTKFGFMVCRGIDDKEKLFKRCRDAIRQQNNYIIVLTDEDLNELLDAKMRGDEFYIERYLEEKLNEVMQ